ncbi:MAG: prepilin-type N-terminal cleavage/methylation domain-containing protein [Planctomycetota bacterium]
MRTRGLTMIELLLALSLLSAILLATFSWTQITGRALADGGRKARWERAATALLRVIHDDLACGDFLEEEHEGSPTTERISVAEGTFRVVTRSGGLPIERQYSFVKGDAAVTLEEPSSRARALLGEVADFVVTMDQDAMVIDVSITSLSGLARHRRYTMTSRFGTRPKDQKQ